MRESNFRSVQSNRASVSITTTLYDRRALDCTSDKPLANSLNHLTFLTSSSARVRETLCVDGGLERLVAILKECRNHSDNNPSLVAWKWTLALQCLMFLGTRGSEKVRKRVVEAGSIPIIATILDNYLQINGTATACCNSHAATHNNTTNNSDLSSSSSSLNDDISSEPIPLYNSQQPTPSTANHHHHNNSSSNEVIMRSVSPESVPTSTNNDNFVLEMSVVNNAIESSSFDIENHPNPRRRFMPHQQQYDDTQSHLSSDLVIVPREDDVLWALEILGFVSKYAHLKSNLQSAHFIPQLSIRDPNSPPLLTNPVDYDEGYWNYDDYDFETEKDIDDEYLGQVINIFPLVEKFTVKYFPKEMQYWAGVIMRNCCRKDESRGGIRQCANFDCGKWEEYPRQFAKCRRCKRTKYCGKDCQLKAWGYHRHWCHPSNNGGGSSNSASTTTSTSTASNNNTTTTTTTTNTTTRV